MLWKLGVTAAALLVLSCGRSPVGPTAPPSTAIGSPLTGDTAAGGRRRPGAIGLHTVCDNLLMSLSPARASVPAAGGAVTFTLTAPPGGSTCDWQVSLNANYLSVTGADSGQGSGTITVAMAPLVGNPREGRMTVAGLSATIVQCGFVVTPAVASIDSSGGTINLSVATEGDDCGWSATGDGGFLSLGGDLAGTSSGVVVVSAPANTMGPRTGTVTIAGQSIAITQAGASGECAYAVTPATAVASAAGGPVMFSVATQPGCAWTASGNGFLSVSNGGPGSGDGVVVMQASANTGGSRSTTVTVAGLSRTVAQDAPESASCLLNVTPTLRTVSAAGGEMVFTVNNTVGAGCTWGASSNADFLTIDGSVMAVDSASVLVHVTANTAAGRTGTLTLAGQTVTVAQAGSSVQCAQLSSTAATIGAAGGPITFDVTANSNACSWTAASNSSFLTVTRGASGNGSGVVEISATAWTGSAQRTGSVAVAGQLVTITQVAPGLPTVTTDSASEITTNQALLSGTVVGSGGVMTAHFQYGTTTTYDHQTASFSLNGSGTVHSTITGLSPGTTYHFRLVASNSGGTSAGVDRTVTTPAVGPNVAAPNVTTGSASEITRTQAILSGTALGNGVATTAYFRYGATTSYGSQTPVFSLSGNGEGSVNWTITGLSPGTTYHYRLVASNGAGTTMGTDRTFTTASSGPVATAPNVTTGSASEITSTQAILSGTALGNGVATTAYFQYGATTGYGSQTIVFSLSGNAEGSVNWTITGLSPRTTYHYRFVATNSGGTGYGGDATFTTAPAPSPTPTVSAPTVTTGSAFEITSTQAILRGTGTGSGPITARFQYGLTTSYGSQTTTFGLSGNGGTFGQDWTITGLTPGTTYHFRFMATNSGGTTYGGDATFTTAR